MNFLRTGITRILCTLILSIMFCFPIRAENKKPPEKLSFLVGFFDLNERAFAYHKHCLPDIAINQTFLKTLEIVADELFSETLKDDPGFKPNYVKKNILRRRYEIQSELNKNYDQNGCFTEEAAEAKRHYEEYSKYTEDQIRELIQEQNRK